MVEVQDLLLDLYLFIWFSSRPVLSQSSDLYNFGDLPFDHSLTLRRPLRKKLRMKWFFDVSKVRESSDAHLLENTDLSPSKFHFSVGFISRSCFESDGFIAYSKE